MKTYNHITLIEIDEVETVVSIDFEVTDGIAEITKMTDVESGDAICPDLMGSFNSSVLLGELSEFAADFEAEKVGNGRFSYSM